MEESFSDAEQYRWDLVMDASAEEKRALSEREGFDPRGSLPLLTTFAAVLLLWDLWLPGIQATRDFPELRTRDPVRALLYESDVAKASTLVEGPSVMGYLEVPCALCTLDDTRTAWRDLANLFSLYDDLYGDDPPPFVDDARALIPAARATSLALFGDEAARSALENPAIGNVARGLGMDPDRARRGLPRTDPIRLGAVGYGLIAFDGLVMLAGLASMVVLARRRASMGPAVVPEVSGPTAGQACFAFLWCWASASAVYALASRLGFDTLYYWYPAVDGVLAVALLSATLNGGSVRRLLHGVGLTTLPKVSVTLHTLSALAITVAAFWLLMLASNAVGYVPHWAETSTDVLLYGGTGERTLRSASLVVAGPIYEELLFTGLLFRGLAAKASPRVAAVVTASIFAVVHAYDVPGSLSLVASSLASCWAFWRSGSLWPSVLLHATLNAMHETVLLY